MEARLGTHIRARSIEMIVFGHWAACLGRSIVVASEGGQPGQHRSIVLPGGFAWSTCDDRITQLQGFGLHANGDLGIAIGRLQIDMSQPARMTLTSTPDSSK